MNFNKFNEKRAREAAYRWYGPESRKKKEIANEKPREETKPSKVHTLDDYWTIENVTFNGVTKNYDLRDSLLEKKTQSQHLEYAKNHPDDFIIRDLPFYHVLFQAIFDSGNKEAIEFVKKSLNDYLILTGTSVKYKSGDKDQVVHNVLGNSIDVKFRGSNEWLKDASDEAVYQALTGDSSKNLNKFYKQINNQDSRLWRFSKQDKLVERAVRLGSFSGRFDFYAGGGLSNSNRCFGVRG